MVISCCAVGCTNRQGKTNIAFHHMPKDMERRKKWITAIHRKNWEPSKHTRLCSAHFVQGKFLLLSCKHQLLHGAKNSWVLLNLRTQEN
uniref:THAP domain-containing protein 1 n=1 Tax=Seriola lalandi dorsalis TaxID=1841481 RepID=A0A3B4WU72_SERLL